MDNKKILIVEDERNLARTLAQALKVGSNGKFQVEVTDTGEEARVLLAENHFDLVISDLRLPGTNGLELITHINEAHGDLSTILITGFGSEEVEHQASKVSDGYLTKPFDMLDLLVMVQRIITHKSENMVRRQDIRDDQGTKSILILEDDPGLQRIYQKALGKANFTVDMATNILEAREHLANGDYNIFICDIHVGRERGTDLLTDFREKLARNDTQVVMVSAYGQYRSLTEEMGADFFLEKPISLGTLLTLINRLMEKDKTSVNH